MSYLSFDKRQLINLNYSLSKELLRSNRAGSYASTTITYCNTRKYHGLLVCPMPLLDNENHVLLSSLDETIIQHEQEFHIGSRKYPGKYNPLGHKYIREFIADPIPTHFYRVGGVVLKKEMLLVEEEERVLLKYTIVDAHSPTKLRFQPFLAFRQVHRLSKANLDLNNFYSDAKNGIRVCLYSGYPNLYMQTSKPSTYIHAPNWYYNVEYSKEQERGYEFHEDLYSPGFFELDIKKGESIVFSAGLTEIIPDTLKRKFTTEVNKKTPRTNFENCLENAAQQFFKREGKKTYVIAGFPWFSAWGRDTFIALPGLTLARNDEKTFLSVLDTMSSHLRGALFPNMGMDETADVNSVDAPLWYFWSIQQYVFHKNSDSGIWKKYGKYMKQILEGYKSGTMYGIQMRENGLIYSGVEGKALTWMDAIAYGKPVTPRIGYDVEINALWYNAINFALELASKSKDSSFLAEWKHLPELVANSFKETFWDSDKKYLADYVDDYHKDMAVRPNQIFAVSLPYSPVTEDMKREVIRRVERDLLTSKGLRTLSPRNDAYIGVYEGNQDERDSAYHQGTAWPWLTGHFCEAYLKLYGKQALPVLERIYLGFEDDMVNQGIGSIAEIYDGDPPHHAKGSISQAWSIAEVLRIKYLINNFSESLNKS